MVHELVQREDGTLGVRMPDTIEQSFTEEKNGRILMDRYNRIDGDQYYLNERPVRFTKNSVKVSLMVSGNIMLVYVNDVELVSRCYEIASGLVGIFTEYGEIRAKGTRLLVQKY